MNIPHFAVSNLPFFDYFKCTTGIEIDLENQEVLVLNNNITHCAQPNNNPPLNSGGFQLITDTQAIGLTEVVYDLGRKAMILTSETDDLICDGAFEFDRIYVDNFE